jgi:hypothetical protein
VTCGVHLVARRRRGKATRASCWAANGLLDAALQSKRATSDKLKE